MRNRLLLPLLILSAIFARTCVGQDIPDLLEVPVAASASDKAVFGKQRSALEVRLDALTKEADAFNAKCGGRTFRKDDPAAQECLEEAARLRQARADYVRDAEAFNAVVGRLSATTAQSATSLIRMGAASRVRGDVFMQPVGSKKQVRVTNGGPIYLNSHITTGPTGRLQILLLDDTVFTLGPEADMTLDEFVYDPATDSPRNITVSIIKGVFRWVTGKVPRARPENMKVHLPVGAIGIRGTDFETAVQPDGSGYIKLFSGKLEITKKKDGSTFSIEAKQMVTFTAVGDFSRPNFF